MQSELVLVHICLVSKIIFSSYNVQNSASLTIHLFETSMIGDYPKASLRICLFQQQQEFDQHVLQLTVRSEI